MRENKQKAYPLDNSAIIHLAAMDKKHTNSFRIAITLTENIVPEILQSALNRVVTRFPTIAAGIKTGVFKHTVAPVKTAPKVMQEKEMLACMTKKEIKKCAFRILYCERQIAGEFFHSLTDGHGGVVFMNTLLAEYLFQLHGINITKSPKICNISEMPSPEEVRDDYFTYAEEGSTKTEHKRVYQLPGTPAMNGRIKTTSRIFDSDNLLGLAHYYDVSLTTLLTAIMLISIVEIQGKYVEAGMPEKSIQIMVPVNLRKLFPSRSLRNFSLYALIGLEGKYDGHFPSLLYKVQNQLKVQTSKENMAAAIAPNTKLEQLQIVKMIPWFMKKIVLKFAHRIWGEQNSCITLSNMGEITIPKEMESFVMQFDVFLTPRIASPYNCGIVSYNGKCMINFTRRCEETELEDIFFEKLSSLMQLL